MLTELTYMTAGMAVACALMAPVFVSRQRIIAGLSRDIVASDTKLDAAEKARDKALDDNAAWLIAEEYWDAERARLNIDLASAKHELDRIGLRRNAKGQLERLPKSAKASGERV